MAAIQAIRKRGTILVTVIAVALALFVLGDLFRGGESIWNQSKQQIGEVCGNTLSIQEYQSMVEELTNYYEIAQQKSTFSEEENSRIKDEAWSNFVQMSLVEKECKTLGLAVTEEEVSDVVKSGYSQYLQVPVFMNQQTGRYDYAQVTAFLTSYQQAKEQGQQLPDAYEKIYRFYMFAQKQIRTQILTQKYQALLASSILSNPVEAKMAFDGRSSEKDLILAAVPFSAVDDKEVEVSDKDIKAKYDEEKEKFLQREETRDVKVLDILVTASATDKAATEAEMKTCYDELASAADNSAIANVVRQNSSLVPYTDILKKKEAFPAFISSVLDSTAVGTIVAPKYDAMQNIYYTYKLIDKQTKADSVLFRQIGVIGKDEKDIATKADSIMKALAAGADFKAIAKKYNQAGDSSWIATDQFQNAQLDGDNLTFINKIYSTPAGQTAKLTLENGNTIIINVLEVKNPIVKYNVAAIVRELKFSDETYNNEYNKFSSFIAENPTLEQIEAAAPKAGYVVRPVEDLAASNHNIAGIRATRDALKWVFDDANVGQVSQLYECGSNDHLMLVALTGINEVGYRSVEKVKTYLTDEVRNEKKAEKILASLSSVKDINKAKSVKGCTVDTVKHVTFAAPAYIASVGAMEPVVSALAAKTANGSVSAAVKGNAGVYMVKVVNESKSSEKFDAKAVKGETAQNNVRNAMNSVLQALYINGNVRDVRYKFF